MSWNDIKEEVWPPGWLPAEDIPRIVNNAKFRNPVGIEIGVDCAYSTVYLLDHIPNLFLYGIDPYTPYEQMHNRDEALSYALRRTAEYGERFKLIREESTTAVKQFKNKTIDFIFVDGNHAYDYVKKDIEIYWPKLKRGGIMFGHDYKGWAGNVDKAVNEWAEKINQQPNFCNQDVWYFIKV